MIIALTCQLHPALWWLSTSSDVTLVESLIRLVNPLDGHLSCRLSADQRSVFVEISWEAGGGFRGSLVFVEAAQRDITSFHRKYRRLQDHISIWNQQQAESKWCQTFLHNNSHVIIILVKRPTGKRRPHSKLKGCGRDDVFMYGSPGFDKVIWIYDCNVSINGHCQICY